MAIVKHNSSKNARYEDVLEYYTCRHREDSRTGHYEPILDEHGLMQTRSNCAALYLTADGTEAAQERWASACCRARIDCDQSALEAALSEWRKLQMLQTSIRSIHYTAERGKARRPEREQR